MVDEVHPEEGVMGDARRVDSYTVDGDPDEGGRRALSASIRREVDQKSLKALPVWLVQLVPPGWALEAEIEHAQWLPPAASVHRWDLDGENVRGQMAALDQATECSQEMLGALNVLREDVRAAIGRYTEALVTARDRNSGVDPVQEAHDRAVKGAVEAHTADGHTHDDDGGC